MFVCICKAVTEEEVQEYLDAGADTPDAIGEQCGAGWGCGTCVNRLDELLCEHAVRKQTAA
ncbi:(2Fe-2S)-binding protein [Rhodococcus sp. NPDC049939]|uniref:(2Fe-2S)-binding protein n=1 Tax=Rhodococcus sp. NPDC049939 TaxID=3155511 RepID=UPI0033FD2248